MQTPGEEPELGPRGGGEAEGESARGVGGGAGQAGGGFGEGGSGGGKRRRHRWAPRGTAKGGSFRRESRGARGMEWWVRLETAKFV